MYLANIPVAITDLTFINNSAEHGNDLASYPNSIRLYRDSTDYRNDSLLRDLSDDDFSDILASMNNTPSGQILDALKFTLVDIFD